MTALVQRRRGLTRLVTEPGDIGGLCFWVKADAITGLVDNDQVSSWADLSGLGNTATRGTAAARPLYKTGILNGMPIVRGDGLNDSMTKTSATGIPGNNNWCMWGVWSNRALGVRRQSPLFLGSDANGYGPAVRADAGKKGALLGGVAWLDSAVTEEVGFEIYVLQRRAGTIRLWVDGGAPIVTSATTPNTPTSTIYLFRAGSNEPADVDIAEGGIHNGATSLLNANQIGSYLGSRWGLPWTTATDS